MKINEKNLCAFASSATPVDRDGWLDMRGEVGKSYQKRWFVLKGNLLFYFDKKGDKEPVGVIILEGCTIELTEEEAYSFKISFQCEGGRTYYLCTNSQASMETWMKALACASYDYMKLMVNDLQRQLDEAQDGTSKEKAVCCTWTEDIADRGSSEVASTLLRFVEVDPSCQAEAAAEAALVTVTPPEDEPKVPPRGQRYNPFNRVTDGETKAVQGSRHHKENLRPDLPRKNVPFRDIHTAYGRKILADRSVWRAKVIKLREETSQPLIQL